MTKRKRAKKIEKPVEDAKGDLEEEPRTLGDATAPEIPEFDGSGERTEASDEPTVSVEEYGGGFILAEYRGNVGRFRGRSLGWSDQPIVEDVFETEAEALNAVAIDRPETTTEEPEPTTGPGTGNAIDYANADFVPIQCPSCRSPNREPFKGRTRKLRGGIRFHAMLQRSYNVVILRPTRCSDCGQHIMSREFVLEE